MIALTLRAYILSWYPRFSKDRTLLPQVHQNLIRPILVPILNRIREHPELLCDFLLLDLPTLLALHIETYWSSRAAITAGIRVLREQNLDLDVQIGKAYHARLPLLCVENGVMGDYALSPLYETALAEAVLHLYIPAAEYGSDVERLLAREVLGRSIILSVGRKVGTPLGWGTLGLKFLGEPDLSKQGGTSIQPETSLLDSANKVLYRFSMIARTVWTICASIIATLTHAPQVKDKYRGVTEPWLKLIRALLGVDGRYGLQRSLLRAKLAWCIVEVIFILLGFMFDR